MLDAAVAAEAYNSALQYPDEMCPYDWMPYSHRTWASEWHKLWEFDPADERKKLTWKNRFGDIPNAVNYYSSGEDVLQNRPANSPHNSGVGGAWTYQELVKGRLETAILPFVTIMADGASIRCGRPLMSPRIPAS